MTWIRFEATEPPVSLAKLGEIAPPGVNLDRMRERFLLVIFFIHGFDCSRCREAVAGFARRTTELDELSARVIVATPELPSNPEAYLPVQIFADPFQSARGELAQLLEFDTRGKQLLFILNHYWSPSAAWVGDDPDESDFHERALQRLNYLAIQCPE